MQTLQHQPTSITDWTKSDAYHNAFLVPADPALDAVVKHTQEEGLPAYIAVSTAQGRFLALVARTVGARRVLEVGTLGGYVQLIIFLFLFLLQSE